MPAAARAFHTFSLVHTGFSLAHASTSTAAALEERLAAAGKPPIRTRAPIEEPGGRVTVTARDENGKETVFPAVVRLNSAVELDYYRHGGILQRVLRQFLREGLAS